MKRNFFKQQNKILKILLCFLVGINMQFVQAAMTMQQMEKTMSTMRSVCGPKNKVSEELMDGIKKGEFPEDKNLKCYTLCIAQMAGTVTKRNELSYPKIVAQIDTMLPVEIKEMARKVLEACKDVYKDFKDPCDRIFYSTKCMYEFDPPSFIYP